MATWGNSRAVWGGAGVLWGNALDPIPITTPVGEVSSRPRYTIEADLSRDGTYDDPYEDVTPYVLAASWRYGMTNAADAGWTSPASRYDGVAPSAHLDITLDNASGLFHPDNSASPYYARLTRGLLIRVTCTLNGQRSTLWTGKLQRLMPVVGLAESQTVTLTAEDQSAILLDSNYVAALQTNVTVDAAIKSVFSAGFAPWPYDKQWWILGTSRLTTSTRLFGSTNFLADIARSTLPWVGDTTGGGEGTSALQFIRDVVTAEAGGRFFWDARRGMWAFHERYHDPLTTTVTDTFTAADFDLVQARYSDDLITRVTVYYQPRAVGTPASVLFSADNLPLNLKARESKTIQMRYRDPDHPGVQLGGYNVITPQLGTDVIANSESNGTGKNRTSRIGIGSTVGAQSTTLIISNPTKDDVWITTLQIRGTPLRRYNQEAAVASSAAARTAYDLQPMTISASQISSNDMAEGVANHLLKRFGTPITRYASIRLTANDSPRILSRVVTAAIGQRFTINDATSGHRGDYFLIGEAHELTPTGDPDGTGWLHRATFMLKPASSERFWLLGRPGSSNLGTSTVLAF